MKLIIFLVITAFCAVYGLDESTSLTAVESTEQTFGIKGGKDAGIKKRPYTVSVCAQYLKQSVFLNGGVLITKKWVITSQFEIKYYKIKELRVRVGSSHPITGGHLIKISKKVDSPIKSIEQYTLTLLKLSHSVKVRHTIKPISLAKSLPKHHAHAILSGYGSKNGETSETHDLKVAKILVISYKKCKAKYSKKLNPEFSKFNFCGITKHAGSCSFDWGDPLIYKGKLIGIVSGTFGTCTNKTDYAIFNDVTNSKIRSWIHKTTK